MPLTRRKLSHSALALLLLLGSKPALAGIDKPPPPNQESPGSELVNKPFPPGMLATYVRAFFRPTETECFTMSGLFGLGVPGSISLLFAHEGSTALNLDTKREGDVVTASVDDGKCRIRLAVSKEVRDGEQWFALHAYVPPVGPHVLARAIKPAPGETKTVAPGITVSVDPETGKGTLKMGSGGDRYLSVGAGFFNDPEPQCLQRKDFFTLSQRGLNIWFLSSRDELPFSIEEQSLSPELGILIKFSAPTCRLSVRVSKEIKVDDVWVPLAPTE